MDRLEVKEILTKLMNDLLENDFIEVKDFKEKHKILLALELTMYGSLTVPWSLEEERKLKSELEEGLTVEEIAELHDRTKLSIKKRITDLALQKNGYKGLDKGYLPWEVEEDEQLLQELLEHKSVEEIAEAHQRTLGSIKARIKKLNIPTS